MERTNLKKTKNQLINSKKNIKENNNKKNFFFFCFKYEFRKM